MPDATTKVSKKKSQPMDSVRDRSIIIAKMTFKIKPTMLH